DLPTETIKSPPRFDELVERQPQIGDLGSATAQADRISEESAASHAASGRLTIRERTMPNGRGIEGRSGPLPDGGFLSAFTDVNKRCEVEARVARLAAEDPLTGLPNRRVFRSALDKVSRPGPAAGDGRAPVEFAVLFLDLDRFKVVNDTLGHRVGDLLLQE